MTLAASKAQYRAAGQAVKFAGLRHPDYCLPNDFGRAVAEAEHRNCLGNEVDLDTVTRSCWCAIWVSMAGRVR